MARECPNGCGRSFRDNGNGYAFHLTWCLPAQPVAVARPAPVRKARRMARRTRNRAPQYFASDDAPFTANQPVRPVRRGPADGEVDMIAGPGFILPRADAERAGLVPVRSWSIAGHTRPEPEPVPTGPTYGPHLAEMVGPGCVPGPQPFEGFRVLRPTAEENAYAESHHGPKALFPFRYSPYLPDTLHSKVTRHHWPRISRALVVDPLATSPVPVPGWRAPVSPYPAITYGPGAERGAGEHKSTWAMSSWPRLEPVRASADERKATRRTRYAGKSPGGCWCPSHGAVAGNGKAHDLPELITSRKAREEITFAEAA